MRLETTHSWGAGLVSILHVGSAVPEMAVVGPVFRNTEYPCANPPCSSGVVHMSSTLPASDRAMSCVGAAPGAAGIPLARSSFTGPNVVPYADTTAIFIS